MELLENFLIGTTGLRGVSRISELIYIQPPHRRLAEQAIADQQPWVAFKTPEGQIAASGAYDFNTSRLLRCHVLHIQWMLTDGKRHQGWWRCELSRPHDWLYGRGIASDA